MMDKPHPFQPVRLSYLTTDADCTYEQLLQWQLALNATADQLSHHPTGTVLVAPQLGLGFFLVNSQDASAELWATDWDREEGLSWDSFTEKARDKHFTGEGWAADLAAKLFAVLLMPRKELEFVPGLRVEQRAYLVATLEGEAVALT